MAHVIQIVADYPPAIDGVGDYAGLLTSGLRCEDTVSVVKATPGAADPASRIYETRRTGRALMQLITTLVGDRPREQPVLLLHYSGYGYASRGCPLWLAQGIEAVCSRMCRLNLLTIFHELYATGPPWRSSFWLSPIQRSVVDRLARASSTMLTNNNRYRTMLERRCGKLVTVMPVPSNVGEPKCLPPLANRSRAFILFGKSATRTRIYSSHLPVLNELVRRSRATAFLDVGPFCADLPRFVGEIPVTSMGPLTPEAISEMMLSARFGAVSLPLDLLAKSGVFAAYASHGIVPFCLEAGGKSGDGLIEGVHFMTPRTAGEHKFEIVSQAVYAWYHSHNVSTHCSTLRRMWHSANSALENPNGVFCPNLADSTPPAQR